MSLAYLPGKWEGFYTYGPDYPVALQTIREYFTVELRVQDGIISGELTDSYVQQYFSEPAIVEGTLIDQTISLVKRYPHFLGIDENDQIFVDSTQPSHEIHFIGQLKRKWFSRDYFIEGKWDISGSFIDESGNAGYYSCDGEWEMHRAK